MRTRWDNRNNCNFRRRVFGFFVPGGVKVELLVTEILMGLNFWTRGGGLWGSPDAIFGFLRAISCAPSLAALKVLNFIICLIWFTRSVCTNLFSWPAVVLASEVSEALASMSNQKLSFESVGWSGFGSLVWDFSNFL